MQLCFRWYGEQDAVTLQQIRQIPLIRGIVAALYDVPASKVWALDRLWALKAQIEAAGLLFEVVESVPVHEDIKLGRATRDDYIEIYKQNIEHLAQIGIKVVCYNFMPLFDWLRTDLAMPLGDGSTALSYDHSRVADIDDPFAADLPAYFPLDDNPQELQAAYRHLTAEALWDHLAYFLENVIPSAERAGIKLALHPDDPPWSVFDIPRIITSEAALERLLALVDSAANGLTFCTGTLGANPTNNLPQMIRRFGERIHFAHCRNIKITGEKTFHESAHPSESGDLDMAEIMQAFHDVDFRGPLRPDHGRILWGEEGLPGYGLYDRALGAMYLGGLWEGIHKNRRAAEDS